MAELHFESNDPEKDLEAVGKSRVGRAWSKKNDYYWVIVLLAIIVGLAFNRFIEGNITYIGDAICLIGVVLFIRHRDKFNKEQKRYTEELKATYYNEKNKQPTSN